MPEPDRWPTRDNIITVVGVVAKLVEFAFFFVGFWQLGTIIAGPKPWTTATVTEPALWILFAQVFGTIYRDAGVYIRAKHPEFYKDRI